MPFERCGIPNATPFVEFGLNMLATGHVGPTIRIFDVTQPLSFAVFNRVDRTYLAVTRTLGISSLKGCEIFDLNIPNSPVRWLQCGGFLDSTIMS